MRKLFLPAGGVLAVALLAFAGCKLKTDDPAFEAGKVKVAVSFPALYSFAANVGGEFAEVKSIKSTQGAHGAEVGTDERRTAEAADVLFINGLGLDDEFARKLKGSSGKADLKVVALGERLPHKLLLHWDGVACSDPTHVHAAGDHDPHCWLGIDQAVRYVEAIADELGGLDPPHKGQYRANAAAYIETLKAIKADGEEALKGTPKERRKVVTVHASMAYFARTFGLTVVDTVQKNAGAEPTPPQMRELIQHCRAEGVRVIATEPQFSKLGAVRTLAEALMVGADGVIELDNLESAPAADLSPDWYERKMRANVAALKGAFGN